MSRLHSALCTLVLVGCGARSELGSSKLGDAAPVQSQPACRPGDSPVALASGEAAPYDIALDDANVYFTNLVTSAQVATVSKAGGAKTTIASNQHYPDSLAVDDAQVFWTDGTGLVRRAAKDGTGQVDLATGQSAPTGIAVDAERVYWVNYLDPGAVSAMPKNGGASTVLATGGTGFSRVALGDTDITWVDFYSNTVLRVPKTGGPVTTIAHLDQGIIGDVAVDGAAVYFTGNMAVLRVDTPGTKPQVLATTTGNGASLALDHDAVYFTDPSAGFVLRVPKGSGSTTTIASGQMAPSGIAVDGACVYWTNGGSGRNDGSVMKAPK